jgi:signal transduction histidine kinase
LSHSSELDRPEEDLGPIPSGLERFRTFLARATRNPIQSIWGALFVIQRRADPGDETLAQAVRIIREEIDQLRELVQETLEFVRPVEKEQMVPVDLNALLNSVLTALTPDRDGSAPSVSVTTSLDPGLPQLQADYEEMKRAFRHILKNIYAALSDNGGALTVETHFSPDPVPGNIGVVLTAKSPGVQWEIVDRTFPSFCVYPHKGNGLGTAIDHRIFVERCQGDMKAERVAEGLRLLVSLPIKRNPPS